MGSSETGVNRQRETVVPDHTIAAHIAKTTPGSGFGRTEFFAGIGLVKLALEKHNWQVVFANDIEPDKHEMYAANFGDEHFHLGDIHQLAAKDIPDCELFTASFPCNDLSIAGAQVGLSGKESSAFWGLVRLLKDKGQKRPPLVMLENVVGFLQSDGGKDFELALLALNELGYAVDAFILNASHWVPQSRARLFVIAKVAGGKTGTSFAKKSETRPEALRSFIETHQNICWDIRELPKLPNRASTLSDILEDLSDSDSQWWSKERSEYFSAS